MLQFDLRTQVRFVLICVTLLLAPGVTPAALAQQPDSSDTQNGNSTTIFVPLVAGSQQNERVVVHAATTTAVDNQANAPQVNGDATSDATAKFPTNKQNEPTIAVNPTDPSYLLAGSNDEQRQPACGPGPIRGANVLLNDCSFFPNVGTSGIYRSTDGGQSWSNHGLLDDQPSWQASNLVSDGDPVIVYGPKPTGSGFSYANGARAYYATLASYKNNDGPYPPNKAPEYLAVSWSDDNGVTWSAPVLATTKNNPNDFNDKESLWVDNLESSPYFGRVYVTYTEFRSAGFGSEPIMVAISTDGGQSFSAPKQLSPAGNNVTGNGRQGSIVRSGPDGSVYVAWVQGFNQVISISRDGGMKWSRPAIIGPVADIADPIPGANFRTDSFLSLAVDRDPNSATLYAAWVNRTASGGRVVFSKSTDKGISWSALQTISGAEEGYAFFQGLDVAPNGRIDVGYQALIAVNPATWGVGNAAIDSWYVQSSDGGSTWSEPAKISSASSDPAVSAQNNLARQFYGDYNTLVSTDDRAWFIYTDTRAGAGCAAIDQYQFFIAGTAVVRGDMGDRIARRLGQDPYAHEPGEKPAPPEHCPDQYGNSDVYVSMVIQ